MNPGSVSGIARIPELNRRILFTLSMLIVYRLGCAVPTPGIDASVVSEFFAQSGGGVFGIVNVFTGGAFEQLSIFALGIMPYISASIILQLLTVVIPKLDELKKEGEEGRRVITRYTRYGTIVLSIVQGLLLSTALEAGAFGEGSVIDPGWTFRIMAVVTLTAGTAFIMWLGEQINERGIGNGISLIIFAGIVVQAPSAAAQLWSLIQNQEITPVGAILLLIFMGGVLAGIVFVERALRRIPIQYARRVVGRRQVAGQTTYFPLRLNTSGVIPPIFASSLLILPDQIATWSDNVQIRDFVQDHMAFGSPTYLIVFSAMIIFFAYFYTGVMINPDDVADNIRKGGGYIPGIRPGKRTAEYIQRVLNRITLIGALYLAAVCVLPILLSRQFNVPFGFGGTALLICVGVAMDFVSQVEAHLVARNYDTFVSGTRIRGRGGR